MSLKSSQFWTYTISHPECYLANQKVAFQVIQVRKRSHRLKDLVNWERLAIHLPKITTSDIEIIKQNKPFDVNAQKQALFDKWLRSYPNASWDAVVLALEVIDENTLAKKLYIPVEKKQRVSQKLT